MSPALRAWEYLGFPHLSGPPWTCVLFQRETPGRRAGRIGRIGRIAASARTGSWSAGHSCLAHSDPSPPPASDLCPWLAAFFPCGLLPFPLPCSVSTSFALSTLPFCLSPVFPSPPFLLPPPFLYRIPCFIFGPFPLFMYLFFSFPPPLLSVLLSTPTPYTDTYKKWSLYPPCGSVHLRANIFF